MQRHIKNQESSSFQNVAEQFSFFSGNNIYIFFKKDSFINAARHARLHSDVKRGGGKRENYKSSFMLDSKDAADRRLADP